MNNVLGYNLKKYRKEHTLTQEEFADMLGISRTALRSYEKGQSHPSSVVLIGIAKVLNCSIDDLLGHHIENKTAISSENISNATIKEKIFYLDELINKTLRTHEELIAAKKRTDLKYNNLIVSKEYVDKMLDDLMVSKQIMDKMFDELNKSNKRNDLTYAELERTINRFMYSYDQLKKIPKNF